MAVHLIVPVNTALVAVMCPALAALSADMGVNAAMLCIPLGLQRFGRPASPLDPVSLVSYDAGYYKMGDMFKPGLLISVFWVAVMTGVMLLIARPLGLM